MSHNITRFVLFVFQEPNEIDSENDDRPECEYGVDCYRKNPQHKKEYRHTTKPRPKRKAKDKAAKAKKAKKEDDDGEYDSSFIDDDESEEDITDDEESVEEWTPDDDD